VVDGPILADSGCVRVLPVLDGWLRSNRGLAFALVHRAEHPTDALTGEVLLPRDHLRVDLPENVQIHTAQLYTRRMDVGISALRADLARWVERARSGEEVVITERGIPVARLVAVDTAPLLEQLTQRGVLSRPRRTQRPTARGARRVHAAGPVAELVSDQRR
jgi:prevent-host-death family protein